MSTVPTASSSEDLLRARALAVRLTSPSSAAAAEPPGPAVSFVAFRPLSGAASLPVSAPAAPASAVPPVPAAPAPPPQAPERRIPAQFGPEVGESRTRRFQRFLSWSAEACGTPVVLVMDSYALLIGSHGPVSQEQAEGLGAHLMVALETADRMVPEKPAVPAIAIAFESLWLTGFRATLGGDEVVTFGVIGEGIPEPDVRALVAECAAEAL